MFKLPPKRGGYTVRDLDQLFQQLIGQTLIFFNPISEDYATSMVSRIPDDLPVRQIGRVVRGQMQSADGSARVYDVSRVWPADSWASVSELDECKVKVAKTDELVGQLGGEEEAEKLWTTICCTSRCKDTTMSLSSALEMFGDPIVLTYKNKLVYDVELVIG